MNKIQNKWWIISSCVQDKILVYYDLLTCVIAFMIALPLGFIIDFYKRILQIPDLYRELKKSHEERKRNIEDYGSLKFPK